MGIFFPGLLSFLLVAFHFPSSLVSSLLWCYGVWQRYPAAPPWPGTALDESFAARALFQRCLLLHLCSPWERSRPCQAEGEKEGRRGMLGKWGESKGKMTRDKQQQQVEAELDLRACSYSRCGRCTWPLQLIKETWHPCESSGGGGSASFTLVQPHSVWRRWDMKFFWECRCVFIIWRRGVTLRSEFSRRGTFFNHQQNPQNFINNGEI